MKEFKGVLLTPKLPRDGNEFARYLAQYLIDQGPNLFWCDPYTGDFGNPPRLIDADALHDVIVEYMENKT